MAATPMRGPTVTAACRRPCQLTDAELAEALDRACWASAVRTGVPTQIDDQDLRIGRAEVLHPLSGVANQQD
jgi:hypothetical protein